jgi:large subunit ribosomal protein L21
MYAIVETGGKQYRVSVDEDVVVEKLAAEPGQKVEFEQVCLVARDGKVTVGKPWVRDAKVTCRVLGHSRGSKIEVFTYKAKENIKRKLGHRQSCTRLRVEKITAGRTRRKKKES